MKLHRSPLSALVLLVSLAPFEAGADANAIGRCAGHSSVEAKIAVCSEAAKSTPYPWILHWIYRDLARAHRERGDTQSALADYARSLAAAQSERVRREMEELAALLIH